MAELSGNVLLNINGKPKFILHPNVGNKQDNEFISLLKKQFSGKWRLETTDDSEIGVGYYITADNIEEYERC